MRAHNLLICTVGATTEPVIASLLEWRPARVLFIPSQQTSAQVAAILGGYAERSGEPLGPGMYEAHPVQDAESLDECLRVVRALEPEVVRWKTRGPDYQVAVDFTAGTKCMTAAVALQARRWPCLFSYVGGERRSKGGVGVVQSGTERVVHSANPWDALGFQAAEDFVTLFDQGAYAAASRTIEPAKRNVREPAKKRALNALQQLARVYDAWDRFDHKSAGREIDDVLRNENDLVAVLGAERMQALRSTLNEHRAYLASLTGAQMAPSKRHVLDLVANARRRQVQGRIDDAVARLYRAIEAIAQITLAEQHNISNTGHVPLERVPETLRSKWASRVKDGEVRLGLQDAYELLAALDDPLAAAFRQLDLDDPKHSPLVARNNSILAHGFQAVSERTFERLWAAAMRLGEFAQGDLPAFPELGRPGPGRRPV